MPQEQLLDELTTAHNRWLSGIDPLLGTEPVPQGENWAKVGDDLVGTWQLSHIDPTMSFALWAADVTENFSFRAAHSPTPEAFEELLGVWLAAREPLPARLTTAVPALATELIPGLLNHGFQPATSAAIRLVGDEPEPARSTGITVREPVPEDRERLLELLLELHVSELPYGATMHRTNARDLLAIYLDEAMRRPDWTFVALKQGHLVGLLTLNPPKDSQWAAPLVATGPVCYLGFAAVTATARALGVGALGVGALLVQHAMHRAHRAECKVVLLDHASLSPLSSTFWHRRGFRPVWSRWARWVTPG